MFYKSNALSWWFCKMFQESHYTHTCSSICDANLTWSLLTKLYSACISYFAHMIDAKLFCFNFPQKMRKEWQLCMGFKLNSSCSQIDIWHQRYYIALLSKDITLDPQAILKYDHVITNWVGSYYPKNCFSYRTV